MYNIAFISTRNDVQNFLDRVHTILQNNADFILIKNRRVEKTNLKYTTEVCMNALEYNDSDCY